MNNLPIAVFDSGVGGLTVLRALQELLPNESYIYFGDTARLPYGTKSPNTIIKYALHAVEILLKQKIKFLVVACNTATSLALPTLEQQFPYLPMVGTLVPGAQAACEVSQNGHIVVIATEATVNAQGYQTIIQNFRPNARVTAQGCSLFVALAEEGWVTGPIAELTAKRYLDPLFNQNPRPDCLLLGCTHFPTLNEAIRNVIGDEVSIIDSATATAQTVKNILINKNLENTHTDGKSIQFLVTDSPERFARVAGQFLMTSLNVNQIILVDSVLPTTQGSDYEKQ